MESLILSTFNFKILFHISLWQLLHLIIKLLKIDQLPFNSQLDKILLFKAKMVMMDYEFITQFSIKLVASSIVYISLKLIQTQLKELQLKHYVKRMAKLFDYKEKSLFKAANQLLNLANVFEEKYYYAQNLNKLNKVHLN